MEENISIQKVGQSLAVKVPFFQRRSVGVKLASRWAKREPLIVCEISLDYENVSEQEEDSEKKRRCGEDIQTARLCDRISGVLARSGKTEHTLSCIILVFFWLFA